jgi:diguanylate cyclase (GGDEF)-like protein
MPRDPIRPFLREPRVRLPEVLADRLPVECSVLVGGAGRLVDVSRNGLRLAGAGDPRPNEQLSLVLSGREGESAAVDAVVRWWQAEPGGRGQGGLRIVPESLSAWQEILEAHVAPGVDAPEALLPTPPPDAGPHLVLLGPDEAVTASLAARLAAQGLPSRRASDPVPAGLVPEAQAVVAGPYPDARSAHASLDLLHARRDLDGALVLLLVPGASAAESRALLEAGAFECLTEQEPWSALDLRLLVALRLSRARCRERLATERLLDACGRDPLTGLANRRQFLALAAEERRRAQRTREPIALMLLDVDHFKQVNDLYGHAAGDAALRALSRLLRRHLRPFDLVGRYGGEEFVILLSGASHRGALTAAERLRATIASTPFDTQGIIRLTASIGVVSIDAGQEAPFATMLASADRALYRAKHGGRNQVRPGVIAPLPAARKDHDVDVG